MIRMAGGRIQGGIRRCVWITRIAGIERWSGIKRGWGGRRLEFGFGVDVRRLGIGYCRKIIIKVSFNRLGLALEETHPSPKMVLVPESRSRHHHQAMIPCPSCSEEAYRPSKTPPFSLPTSRQHKINKSPTYSQAYLNPTHNPPTQPHLPPPPHPNPQDMLHVHTHANPAPGNKQTILAPPQSPPLENESLYVHAGASRTGRV